MLTQGELAVYFEVGSFLPVRDEIEILRKSSDEGCRLRSMTFKGQISQGLLLPVSLFQEISEPCIGCLPYETRIHVTGAFTGNYSTGMSYAVQAFRRTG